MARRETLRTAQGALEHEGQGAYEEACSYHGDALPHEEQDRHCVTGMFWLMGCRDEEKDDRPNNARRRLTTRPVGSFYVEPRAGT